MLYPVPAVMVSCGREGEIPNTITVAWAGTVYSDPAMVSISTRKERFSHSITRDTREFIISLMNKRSIRATDHCGVKSSEDMDKSKGIRLIPQASRYVKAPGVEESLANIGRRIVEVKELRNHDMFIAKVMGATTDNRYMDGRRKFSLNMSRFVSYSHRKCFEPGRRLGSSGCSARKPVKGQNDGNRTSRRKKA